MMDDCRNDNWPECVQRYQVRFPLRRAAYVDLAKRNEEDVAHERVLQQATDERPLPVILFHKPALRAGG